ncbi:MAG TPA: MucB/RseB C-terminal domain-containing protein [Usitatibacteraceae bacterium]|nr:MucB/RseB C-terminal domain-containing protein [Usitatibacteraceae bacterium]
MRRQAAALASLALGAGLAAVADPGSDPVTWLQRAATSARQTTYAGTVMHMQGERTATSRITHVFVSGSEHEKIESLDGPRREIVRHDDQMQCFFPDAKTIRIDRRVTAKFFPSLVGGPMEAIAENYKLALGNVERVLGQDCQWILLDPKDALRYAQRLCAEVGSGLLLRAKTLGAKQQVLEQYAFTDLRVGRDVSRGEVKSTFLPQSKDWRRDVQPPDEPNHASTGWSVALPPPGFRLVGEMQRKLPNRAHPVTQLVLSDGIATMSVFIEPMSNPPRTAEAANEDGALSVFVRPMGENIVTVLGEVPPSAAQQVGRSIARHAAVASGAAR